MWPFTRRRPTVPPPVPSPAPEAGRNPFAQIIDSLLAQRIILLFGVINDELAHQIIQQLLFLQYENRQPITIEIIDSPGGSVAATCAIIDTIEFLECPVHIRCRRSAHGGAAIILACGARSQRVVSPESVVSITQITFDEPNVSEEYLVGDRERLANLLARHTGRSRGDLLQDLQAGHQFGAEEAVAYGLADRIEPMTTAEVSFTSEIAPQQLAVSEADWMTCGDPSAMLLAVRGIASDRQLRLFAVACCREIWRLCRQPESRRLVELSEAYADGEIGTPAFVDASRSALHADTFRHEYEVHHLAARAFHSAFAHEPDGVSVFSFASALHTASLARVAGEAASRPEAELQASLVRCIFGNPFRPVELDPRWRTSDVLGLARAIYEDRAFERLPILGDALMDAGCEDEQVMDHCRSAGPHARGCWVVDLVLANRRLAN